MTRRWYDRTIADLFFGGTIRSSGRFGVEVEVEGSRLFETEGWRAWRSENDSSLRGESREYVFREPLDLPQAEVAVTELYRRILVTEGGSISDSMRAGVHVHINMLPHTLKQVTTFLMVYWLVEGPLIRGLAGEERDGNAFCMKLSEADFPIELFHDRMLSEEPGPLSSETQDLLKYSSMNWAPLTRFGSVEARSLRTPVAASPILSWLRVLHQLYTSSLTFTDPLDFVQSFSDGPATAMAERLLGPAFFPVLRDQLSDGELRQNLRRTQFLAYEPSWR